MYLTSVESDERIQIPLLPDRIAVKAGASLISSSVIKLGEVKIPRGNILTGYSWSGIFPGAQLKNAHYVSGWQQPKKLVSALTKFMDAGTTLRFMVTELAINVDVFIESFTYEYYGGAGDISYTISLTKRRAITIKTVPPKPSPEPGPSPVNNRKYGTVKLNNKNSHLNVRKKPSTSASIIGKLKHGTKVELLAKKGNWYTIPYAQGTDGKGYVYASYIKEIAQSASNGTNSSSQSASGSKTYTVKSGDSLYSIAKAKLGKGTRYPEIYELNKTAIDSKNKGKKVSKYTIYTGMKLKLP